MLKWSLEVIELPLEFTWSISRGSSSVKRNILVTVEDGAHKGRGEIAFNNRYGESESKILAHFMRFQSSGAGEFTGLEQLHARCWELKLLASLRCGLELALADFLALQKGISVSKLLGQRPTRQVKTSFSLPIMPPGKVGEFIKKHRLERFSCLKIKVEKDSAKDKVLEVLKHFKGPLRVDANESWKEPRAVLDFIQAVGASHLEFIEQPLCANLFEEALELKKHSSCILMADESLTDGQIGEEICQRFHGVNIKLMKSGGYIRALEQLRSAQSLGLKTMLGCMVETSLGISCALNIGQGVNYFDLDGFLLLEKDPFNLVSEEKGALIYNRE